MPRELPAETGATCEQETVLAQILELCTNFLAANTNSRCVEDNSAIRAEKG